MPKLSYKERARLRREKDILRTAARLIRDHGYMNLNMDTLAEEVGISKPTLYQHFKGKDDMVLQTMLHTMRDMVAYMQDLPGERAIDKLENIMRYMLESHSDPEGLSFAIVQDSATVLRYLMDGTPEMQTIQRQVGEQVYTLIDAARAEGDIHADISNIVVMSVMFASLSTLRGPDIIRDHSTPPPALIEQILAFFRRGVAP